MEPTAEMVERAREIVAQMECGYSVDPVTLLRKNAWANPQSLIPKIAAALADERARALEWKPIATVPRDGTPVEFANFDAVCMLTDAPHVWAGRYHGDMMLECSFAATNENGEPSHWRELPEWSAEIEAYVTLANTGQGGSGRG